MDPLVLLPYPTIIDRVADCEIRFYRTGNTGTVVIVEPTFVGLNTFGCVERLANRVCWLFGLDPRDVFWIYESWDYDGQLNLHTIDFDLAPGDTTPWVYGPSLHPIQVWMAEAFIGMPWPIE